MTDELTEELYGNDDERNKQLKKNKEGADALLNNREARRVIYQFINNFCMVNEETFNTNALTMAMLEGKRSAGLYLAKFLKATSRDSYKLMEKENDV